MPGIDASNFITEWLVSDVSVSPFPLMEERPGWMDQLAYEARLRSGLSDWSSSPGNGLPPADDKRYWWYWYRHGSWFVDFSSFYGTLTDVRFDLRTMLRSTKAITMEATLWTFAAVEVLVNGRAVARTQSPIYKPIARQQFLLNLPVGDSDIVLRARNLGVRDTRNIVGLQLSDREGLSVVLPTVYEDAMRTARLLDSLTCSAGALRVRGSSSFSDFPPSSALLVDGTAVSIGTGETMSLPGGCRRATVECRTEGNVLRRSFELSENFRPVFPEKSEGDDLASHRRRFIARIVRFEREPRSSGVFFSVFYVLARLAGEPGSLSPEDRGFLLEDLRLVSERVDCADFLVVGFVRLVSKYREALDEALLDLIRDTLLGFRYWMDEDGSDSMCFWSENHAIMFHGAQAAVGAMFPEDFFPRSGRIGREQSDWGNRRCRAWIADAEREGFEEFNSASYTPVTLAALLNLVDFGPPDIAQRASALIDSILRCLARHVFRMSVVGPQGRVYRDVIYPFRQSVQALLNYIDPALPCSDTETMWNVCFATTDYRFPPDLKSIMDAPFSGDYISGNARVVLEKTSDYLLSCVRSPRHPGDEPAWTNLCFVPDADQSTNVVRFWRQSTISPRSIPSVSPISTGQRISSMRRS